MNQFYKILSGDHTYQALLAGLEQGQSPQLLTGLSAVHKAHLIYSLTQTMGEQALVVTPDEPSGIRMVSDLNHLLGFEGAFFFPNRELVFREMEGASQEYEHARLGVLGRMLAGEAPIVVSAIGGAVLYTIPPRVLGDHTHQLKIGETYPMEDLIKQLVAAGYQRGDQVDGISQFAVRGGILDLFSPSQSLPYRVEFWGDDIDTISTFDLASQRRLDPLDQLEITPVREALITNQDQLTLRLKDAMKGLRGSYGKLAKEQIQGDILRMEDDRPLVSADRYLPLLYPEPASLFAYRGDRLLFVSEPTNSKETLEDSLWQQGEDVKVLLEQGVLFPGCTTFWESFPTLQEQIETKPTVILDTFVRSLPDIKLAAMHQLNVTQLSPWGGDLSLLVEDLEEYLDQHFGVIVLAGTEKSAKTLIVDLIAQGIPAQACDSLAENPKGRVVVCPGSLSAGMKYSEMGLAVITHLREASLTPKRKARYKSGKRLREISDLAMGDYVVHSSHGIGVFEGIQKREIHGVTKDYINIRYRGTDALFVPVTQLDLVSKYIGAGEHTKVKLNRLNSLDWQKTRNRVKGAVKEMAKELTQIYAKRLRTPGFAFSPDTDWQRGFEERFPFEETEDQLRCVEEIKEDMERPSPMDRLLCGDVGFGKTEVALRAIFKCVMDSKQAAVLVPTTILAWQHFQTFQARLEGHPIRVELLSRFRTPKQQKEIVRKLKSGEIDVVVGTHRVVQKDVEFKDLGLCVIDEEQRFGVAHKERFKELRSNVDVLTLSATPIPRTLNMAMSGIRDMSLIEQAPQDRHPVQTYVMEQDQGVLLQAIQKELRRGGQVFYLHNNISTIDRCAYNLQQALPDARIMAAHGRMGEEQLSDIWRSLMEQELDILVCTTIIETGVDVPNANTLIIEDADNYGLSQLYQIRGRVGRSSRRAYAYLTFKRGKALTDIATKRLTAIREFTTFGSGFQIAMRDLEIRGAGNILGAQQHGHMESVGYDMYLRLLEEAVQEETGQTPSKTVDCTIDIRLDAYIPETYISNTAQRIDAYKRISSIASVEDSLDVTDELIDRFGEPPTAVMGLIQVALVRGSAGRAGITEITQTEEKVFLYPQHLHMELASRLVGELGRRVLVNAGEKPYFAITINKGQSPLEVIGEALEILGGD